MGLFIRILAYILAAFMIFMGANKVFADAPIFQIIEARTGLGIIEPGFRYLTGFLEFAAAGLLIFGRRFLGAALSLAITGGAVLAHLTVLGISTPEAAFAPGVTAATFECGADGVSCSPVLFFLAIAFTAVSAALAVLTRPSARIS